MNMLMKTSDDWLRCILAIFVGGWRERGPTPKNHCIKFSVIRLPTVQSFPENVLPTILRWRRNLQPWYSTVRPTSVTRFFFAISFELLSREAACKEEDRVSGAMGASRLAPFR